MGFDFSKIGRWELVGAVASALGAVTLFLLPWYSVKSNPTREAGDDWLCGVGDMNCTGWETFPILRWVLILFGTAPLVLAWILIRGHKLAWPPGEMTMTVGLTGLVLIGYNGIIDKPGTGTEEIGVGLDWGYLVALLVGVLITSAGWLRMQEGQRVTRKAPGTV